MIVSPVYTLSCNGRMFGTHNDAFQKSVIFAFPTKDHAVTVFNHIDRYGLTSKIEYIPVSKFRMRYDEPRVIKRPINKRSVKIVQHEQEELVLRNQRCGVDTFVVDEFGITPKRNVMFDGTFVDILDIGSNDEKIFQLEMMYETPIESFE